METSLRPRNPGAPASAVTCVTCGAALAGKYCHECGELSPAAHDPRLSRFVRDAASGAFDLDSRLWLSFRMLFLKPGHLTREFIRGRRRPYLGPVQIFLLANLLFFAVLSTLGGFGTFTTRLEYHRTSLYGSAVERLTATHGEVGTPEAEAYRQRFNEATPRYANSMVILMVPLLALVMKLLSPRRHYVHHLVLALHFMAFMLIVNTVLPFVIRGVVRAAPGLIPWFNGELAIGVVILSILLLHLSAAWRRAYDDALWPSIARAFLAIALFVPVLTVYRMLLFFAVYFAL